jgi:hypothetical protein
MRKAYRIVVLAGIVLGLGGGLPRMAGQSINQGQIHGVVTDSSGAVIAGAKVTITDTGTNISQTTQSNPKGTYVFPALRASDYRLTVSAPGFATVEKSGIVLAVNQQTTLNVMLSPAGNETSVTVQSIPVLLDTSSATLGTTISKKYLEQLPLPSQDVFGLAYLSAGVTETAGSGIRNSYPAGTNFVSNGQRNSTANIRLDGVLITSPEQGEGANSNTYYQALSEALQETNVANNSTSAEYGGGTVINEVMKSGTNHFHGSLFWYNQDGAYNARDFFNSGPKPSYSQNQDGFTLGGPIVRDKTFFFGDLQSMISSAPVNIVATVPTAAEINGDFSQAGTYDQNGNPVLNQIFDPFQIDPVTDMRPAYPNNTIPQNEIDPVGQAIMKLYPKPNTPGDSVTGANNYRGEAVSSFHALQLDLKVDQQFSPKSSLSVRYGSIFDRGSVPTVFGDSEFNDGSVYTDQIFNTGINYTYTPTANTLWISTIGLDRVAEPTSNNNYPAATAVGFPAALEQNGFTRMPGILMENSPWTSLYSQCCVDTKFAHTLLNYTSAFEWTVGQQTIKVGGEQHLFYNNFFQPNYPTGSFSFSQNQTAETPNDTDNGIQGNDFASLLVGWGDYGSTTVSQPVADKSKETAFYVEDDWRVTSKLTLNIGLRYQWDTPYTERHNNSQFSDFTGDSGIAVAGYPGTIAGTTIFASSKMRRLPIDWSDVDPRFGFAYLVNQNLVIRGGAGIYSGYPIATNFQYPGAAYTSNPQVFFSKDDGVTQYATLENPFPGGIPPAQGQTYGKLALWGLPNDNNLGTAAAKDADIYQWNLGIQESFPGKIVVAINYSANRSTHLPWAGTDNRNFIPSAVRKNYTSDQLNGLVNNPFQPLFTGPGAIFNVPSSRYSDAQLPLLNLLRPYPQFDGTFSGNMLTEAASWYNALQVVFHRRAGRYLNFEGNYTWSKNMDNSSAGANSFIGTLASGYPQELDRLNKEWSVSANDATNRFVLAMILQLPIGRGSLIGSQMNRVADAFVGGWQLTTLSTYQSGQPLNIYMGNPRLADGNQRPDVVCSNATLLKTGISYKDAAMSGNPYLNESCFADPGDQQAGDAPRYFSGIRSDGIHDADVSLEKTYNIGKHRGQVEVHVDCFNCTNTPRFAPPDTGYQDGSFGTVSSTASGSTPRNLQLGLTYEF